MPTEPLSGLLVLPGVPEAVADVRAAVDRTLAHRIIRRKSSQVAAESSLRGAWAAAWLAGARLPLEHVREGGDDALADPILQGALRAYGALGELADVWGRAPRQVLARAHVLAAADLVDDAFTLGTPRAGGAVAVRLDTLAQTLATTCAPAVVIAAIVHAEVAALDAFPPVSGVVARVAARCVLIDRGLDPSSVVIAEVGQRDMSDAHRSALAGYGSGATGLATWIRHYASTVTAGAVETLAICEALQRGAISGA